MYFGGTKANTAAMKTRDRATVSVACRSDARLQKENKNLEKNCDNIIQFGL